jgi:membrane dipeptidase
MKRKVLLALAVATLWPAMGHAQKEDLALAHARRLLRSTILIDGHNDLPWEIRTAPTRPRDVVAYDLLGRAPGQTDLRRLREGGVGAQFWSVYIPSEDPAIGYAKVQLEQIDLARRMIAHYPNHLSLALTGADIERAWKEGRVASLLGMEGGQGIERSLGALRAYFELGVRSMTLTHNKTLDWADAATDTSRHGGLTRFGEEVVREMNRLGMLVDLSHTSEATVADAIRVSEAPVIFSHSSARALCDVARNVPDDVLRQMPGNGGVVMVTFVASFVSPEFAKVFGPIWAEYERRAVGVKDPAGRQRLYKALAATVAAPKVTIGQVADHVEHVRKVAGVDHVGIGGDYDGNSEWPEGMEDVSGYPRLFAELVRRGWSDAELRKLAGENVLRAMRGAEAVALRLRATRAASTATIEELDGRAGRGAKP